MAGTWAGPELPQVDEGSLETFTPMAAGCADRSQSHTATDSQLFPYRLLYSVESDYIYILPKRGNN